MASNGVPGEEGTDKQPEVEQVITPWEVSGKGGRIDYDKLIQQFGCQNLDLGLVQRVERLTGKPAHPFLRRGVFFAHRFASPSCVSCIMCSLS